LKGAFQKAPFFFYPLTLCPSPQRGEGILFSSPQRGEDEGEGE